VLFYNPGHSVVKYKIEIQGAIIKALFSWRNVFVELTKRMPDKFKGNAKV